MISFMLHLDIVHADIIFFRDFDCAVGQRMPRGSYLRRTSRSSTTSGQGIDGQGKVSFLVAKEALLFPAPQRN